jgi:hypothetical protein
MEQDVTGVSLNTDGRRIPGKGQPPQIIRRTDGSQYSFERRIPGKGQPPRLLFEERTGQQYSFERRIPGKGQPPRLLFEERTDIRELRTTGSRRRIILSPNERRIPGKG